MFTKSKLNSLNVGQANSYRLDIGLGGLVLYGGYFLSLAKKESEYDELTHIFIDETDCKNPL